jgi:hypothetical protein
MPSGEETHSELKPSNRPLLLAGPARPHSVEYDYPPFPNLYEIMKINAYKEKYRID